MKKLLFTFLAIELLMLGCNQTLDNNPRIVPDGNLVTYDIIGYGPISRCDQYYYYDNIEEEYGEYVLGKCDFVYSYQFDEEGRIVQADYPGQRDTYEYTDTSCVFKSYYLKKLSGSRELRYSLDSGLLHSPYESVKEFDSNGRILQETLSEPSRYKCCSGESFIRVIYNYTNEEITQSFFNQNDVIVRKFITNSEGYKDILYNAGEIHSTLKYDIKHNVLSEEDTHHNIKSYKYEFDDHGNWIKKESYWADAHIPSSVVERKIEYY